MVCGVSISPHLPPSLPTYFRYFPTASPPVSKQQRRKSIPSTDPSAPGGRPFFTGGIRGALLNTAFLRRKLFTQNDQIQIQRQTRRGNGSQHQTRAKIVDKRNHHTRKNEEKTKTNAERSEAPGTTSLLSPCGEIEVLDGWVRVLDVRYRGYKRRTFNRMGT